MRALQRVRLVAVIAGSASIALAVSSCSMTANEVAPSTAPAQEPTMTAIPGFDSPQVLVASSDGKLLYVAQNDGTVVQVSTPSYKQAGKWDSGITVPLGIALTSDGTSLYLSNRTVGTVIRKNAATGATLGSWSTGSGTSPTGIGLSPDGATMYVPQNASAGTGADKLTVRTAINGALQQTWTFKKGSRPRSIVVSPDGKQAFVSMEGANRIAVLNTSDGSELESWDLGSLGFTTPGYLALSKNGDRLYVATVNPTGVLVLATKDGSSVEKWTEGFKSAFGVATASCGQTVFVSDWTKPGNVDAVDQPNQCADVPGQPNAVKATVNNKTNVVTVSWTAPASSGGSPILRYTATATDNNPKSDDYTCTTPNGTTLKCSFTVKGGGPQLEVTVTATNASGTGLASAPPIDVKPG